MVRPKRSVEAFRVGARAGAAAAAADPVPRAMNLISIARAPATQPRQRTLDGDQVRDDLDRR